MNRLTHERETSEDPQIRLATLDDLDALTNLCAQLGYPAEGSQVLYRLENLLKLANHALLVAVSSEEAILGWVHVFERLLLVQEPAAELGGLVVEKKMQKKGVGRALMLAAEQWARSRGLRQLTLRSNINRAEAHEFYITLGYELQKTSYTFNKGFPE